MSKPRKPRKPVPLTDPVAVRCLGQIRTGRMDAALVLADRLEEMGHPLAGRVRARMDKWGSGVAWDQNRDFARNRIWTRWESIGARHWGLWDWFRRTFGRDWQFWGKKPNRHLWSDAYRKLYDLNEKTVALLFPVAPNL